MNTIDCHCHLSFLNKSAFTRCLQSAEPNKQWVLGGYDPQDWRQQIEFKSLAPTQVKTAFGLHPWYVKSEYFGLNDDFEKLKEMIFQADLFGEIGLDYFGDGDLKKQLQLEVFERQLAFGNDKPFVFHIVQAHGDALALLNDFSVRGYVHSFSGSIEVAEKYVAEGILLSFGPNILNENFKKSRETLQELPLEAILIESDAPHYGVRNTGDPTSQGGEDEGKASLQEATNPNETLLKVAREVAMLKNIELSELLSQVELNFKKLFPS